jgi:hypothetical protein
VAAIEASPEEDEEPVEEETTGEGKAPERAGAAAEAASEKVPKVQEAIAGGISTTTGSGKAIAGRWDLVKRPLKGREAERSGGYWEANRPLETKEVEPHRRK